jgi:signal transduction histidine kinase/DNA-binding response OmpR family regulator/ligand-binding sensor domain-containing protein
MKFFCFCFLFLFVGNVFSNAQSSIFERVTIEHGLSQGMIYDVLQTKDGFLWIATKDGLNRYDGYNFKVFSNDPFDAYSVAENTITTLFEDSRGWLWVGTDSKGVDIYDRKSGRFHHFALNFKHQENEGKFGVISICEDLNGSIYLLQPSNGLVRIVIPAVWKEHLPTTPDFSPLTTITQYPTAMFQRSNNKDDDLLSAIEVRDDGQLVVYTPIKAYLLQVDQGIVTPISAANYVPSNKNGDDVWVAQPSAFIRFRNGSPTVFDFSKRPKKAWVVSKRADNGAYWLGINNELWHVLPGENVDFSKPDWIIDENITVMEADRNGNVWVGTYGYGLRKLNPQKKSFHTGAAGTSIWGLWRDTYGRYYCKVANEVFPYDPVTGQIGTERAFPNTSERILDISIEPSGAMWLLGRGDVEDGKAKLWHFDPKSGIYRAHSFKFSSYVYARILRNRANQIWITGLNCQLIRFDVNTSQFDYFDYTALFDGKISTVRAFALAEDGNGVLWIGTQQGLVKCTPNGTTFDFKLIQADPNNPRGLNNNSIACLLPDPNHPSDVLWIGTKGGGINRLDIRSGEVQHITTTDGLPDKVVYGILPGNENPSTQQVSLWCSTNRGLAKLLPNHTTPITYNITTFSAAKGLQDNEFNTQAFFKAANGELLFGGVNGLNRFFPEALRSDTTPPPVFIVGVEINHQHVTQRSLGGNITTPMEYLREINLSYDQNNLSLEFAALDFTAPSQNRYRYKLVGLDADWVEIGGTRFAHFTHLAPKTYTFRVQGSNGEGAWQEAAHPIVIIVQAPWYRSNLAYVIYFSLLVWFVWWAYHFQMKRLREREQLAFEQREKERIKAMEQTKNNFFSNITHEFRTPLSLILEPVRRILAKAKDADITENARHIEKNSYRLLALVNQLLDMAKIESGSMRVDLRCDDLATHIRTIFYGFQPLAAQRGIHLSLQLKEDLSSVLFDANKVELVLNNLLSNALKFTAEGGKVTLSCQVNGNSNGHKMVQMFVSDTGVGIPEQELDKVFNRFYQVDSSHTRYGEGTGIGLALSKELAELMGGNLTVQSEEGKGAIFTFSLPIETSLAETVLKIDETPQETLCLSSKNQFANNREEQYTVLLIEDNTELRAFVKKCIAHAWQVIEASNGEEGVQKAIDILPDLVISDVMMPLKDGYAVCDDLKNNELTSHIPVILLTAKSAIDAKLKGLRTGADDYLTKPFNSEELLARMDNLVTIRRQLRQRYNQSSKTNNTSEVEAALTPPDREFLRRFILILEQHLQDGTLGIEELAQKMFISRVQLHRKLKAITDQNATDFVRDYRLNRAMSMLQNREGMVFEVANQVGFTSEKYFSRVFKEKFGVPPSQVV